MQVRRGRGFASWQVLVVLAVLAGVLLVVQRRSVSRDVELAAGPPTPEQRAFFDRAADRPDLDLFFKALPPAKRQAMARNLGEHANANSVKAAARLLATFDEKARAVLIGSLSKIASVDASLVAAELGMSGSFERVGIFQALRSAGEEGLRAAAAALSDPGRRGNAMLFLAEEGLDSEPVLLPLLDHEDASTRAAAAEVLGKIRSCEAVDPLLAKLSGAVGDERRAYLVALADIGDPRAEDELHRAIRREPDPSDAPLLEGLGRIATARSVERLIEVRRRGDEAVRDAALQALVIGGDRSIELVEDPKLRLGIASKVRSPAADQAIRKALGTPELRREAIAAAAGREALAEDVWPSTISEEDPTVPQRMSVLSTTARGREILKGLARKPGFSGFAKRALALAEG